ncbi:SGNH/GDSL hydrolase family protein [Aureitalea sp. L0-47]|uniref:SGNH/GDSL hydrolase family protein n=1 Tax=Aureitalea sp. L0-47 TaxID=2816962 RepID=UPI002238AE86|nr:SGNH/GDSL hydrolase family protein [Aureitalea sp. L0-47]MCW5518528.1 SGNH/GDSL hydrolase family protein [Aureitalea sp. L0-47]
MNRDSGRSFIVKKKTVLWILYIIVLIPICLELALRVISAKPYIQTDYHIEVSPPKAFTGHDSLGIVLNPGNYDIILNRKVKFHTTHTSAGQRLVPDTNSAKGRPQLAFLGCSFTYGYGVNDEQTFASILQKKYPKLDFHNYGVIGYGTLQSYFQLESLLKNGTPPEVVILNFASDHFERNALTRKFRRAMKIGFDRSMETAREMMRTSNFPYLQNPEDSINYERWEDLYSDWRWRDKLASVNYIQTQSDKLADSSRDLVDISAVIIEQMNKLCLENDIQFVVVLLDEDDRIRRLEKGLTNQKIEALKVGFNFNSPEYTNVPFDIHPNQKGHKLIASKIEDRIKTLIPDE